MADPPDPLDRAVEQACQGDEPAFRLLWRTLQPALLRYLQVVGGGDADDLASETWASVVRDLHKFRGSGRAFRGWLFTIARHRAIDGARRRNRQRRALGPIPTDDDLVMPSAEEETATAHATKEALALVAALPARQAEAVSLRIIAGLDTATAAAIARTSPESIRVNLHRGLRALAEQPHLNTVQETVR